MKKFKISRIHIQFVKKIYETKNFCNKRTKLTFTLMKRAMFYMFSNFNYLLSKWNITVSENTMKTFHKWPWVSHSFPSFKNQFAYTLGPLCQNHSRIIIVILRWSGWSLFLGCRCIMSYRIYTRQWQVLSLITRGRGLWECWQVGGSRHCGHVVHSLMRVVGWSPRVHMRWVGIPQWLWVGIPRGHVHRWVVWGIT